MQAGAAFAPAVPGGPAVFTRDFPCGTLSSCLNGLQIWRGSSANFGEGVFDLMQEGFLLVGLSNAPRKSKYPNSNTPKLGVLRGKAAHNSLGCMEWTAASRCYN